MVVLALAAPAVAQGSSWFAWSAAALVTKMHLPMPHHPALYMHYKDHLARMAATEGGGVGAAGIARLLQRLGPTVEPECLDS